MRRRTLVVTLAAGAAAAVGGAYAVASSCAPPTQEARLELESVTVDGQPEADLSRYQGLLASVRAVSGGAPTPGAQFLVRGPDRHYFQEFFSDPAALRDR